MNAQKNICVCYRVLYCKKRMRPDQKILTRPLYVKSDYFKGEFGSFFI